MKLAHVSLSGVRGVTVELPLAGKPCVCLTGPVGSGKTTVLETIASAKEVAGYAGVPPRRSCFAPRGGNGSVTLQWELDADHAKTLEVGTVETRWDLSGEVQKQAPSPLVDRLRSYRLDPLSWKAEYFHVGRVADAAPMDFDPGAGPRLTKAPHKYAWLRSFLEKAAAREGARTVATLREEGIALSSTTPNELSGFGRNVAALSTHLRWLGTEAGADGFSCLFARRRGGSTAELAELTDSERMVVVFAATIEALGLYKSLVLVDLPEFAIHPEDQAGFFEGLAGLLHEGQLIAATTSPAILRSLPRERVVVLG